MSKQHPASTIDSDAAAQAFALSITGKGPHWDKTMAAMHPKMADSGNEHAWYVIDHCLEIGLCEDEPLSGSDEEAQILEKWCDQRAKTCKQKLEGLTFEEGYIRAYRIIETTPEKLRPALGIFWSHTLENWDDPITPWGEGRGKTTVLLIEALVPLEAIDWQTSCLAHMDWMVGDTESELRMMPGYPLKEVKVRYLKNRREISIPDVQFTT